MFDSIEFDKQNKWVLILFFLTLIFYVASSYYKTHYAAELFNARDAKRDFITKLNFELQNKAGMVISRNNFDPILPNTLLRILLKTPENYIKSYTYNKDLIITPSNNGNVIDIRDIVKYLVVNKNGANYVLYLH
jgi:hypothetical protein